MEDLGLWRTVDAIRSEGPRGIAFDSKGRLHISTNRHILRRDKDGSIEELPGIRESLRGNIGNIAISASDELYYTGRGDNVLLRWDPNGSSEVIASGITDAENMAFGLDGTLYLAPMNADKVLTVDVSGGATSVFATGCCNINPCFLAVDPDGDLWVRGLPPLHQFSPDGAEKPFVVDGELYGERGDPRIDHYLRTAAGIAFDDEGGAWIASYRGTLIRLVPLQPGQPDPEFHMEVVFPGFAAMDLAEGPDGAIYATDECSGRVLRFGPDGSVDTLVEHGFQDEVAVAVDRQSRVYLALPSGEIVRLEADGGLSHYASLYAKRIVLGGDGALYAAVGRDNEPRSIVRITDVDTFATIATEIAGISLDTGRWRAHISPALDTGLYVWTEAGLHLFVIDFAGQGRHIASLRSLGRDSGGPGIMAASPATGDVYMWPDGPMTLFKVDPEGRSQRYAKGIYGDASAMVVSRDGKWLYLAENGIIHRIPLVE